MKKFAVVLGCILYVVSPIDLLPDLLPLLGQLDDLGAIVLTVVALLKGSESGGEGGADQ
jgi:uncharacterized membrane protein YkvA (DUF1232 family)